MYPYLSFTTCTGAVTPGPPPTAAGDSEEDDEDLPVTSYPNQWKPSRKRKQSKLKFVDVTFEKHTYGRERKHQWKMIEDFDPRHVEYRGSAPEKLRVCQDSKGERTWHFSVV